MYLVTLDAGRGEELNVIFGNIFWESQVFDGTKCWYHGCEWIISVKSADLLFMNHPPHAPRDSRPWILASDWSQSADAGLWLVSVPDGCVSPGVTRSRVLVEGEKHLLSIKSSDFKISKS